MNTARKKELLSSRRMGYNVGMGAVRGEEGTPGTGWSIHISTVVIVQKKKIISDIDEYSIIDILDQDLKV